MSIAHQIALLKTQIVTPRFEETCIFYGGLLGCFLVERWDHPSDASAIYQIAPGAQLEIHRGDARDLSGVSLQFMVDDVERITHALDLQWRHLGVSLRRRNAPYCQLTDPAGVKVIIYSEDKERRD